MKTLYLLRHAKSSWSDPSLHDRDRPLNQRGRQAAPLMGRHMQQELYLPEIIYCSSAARTRETLTRLTGDWDEVPPVYIEDGLYEFGAGASYLEVIRSAPDDTRSIMLIGHNPSMEMLADYLTAGGDQGALERMSFKFPTCALAVLSFDLLQWSGVKEGSGRLENFIAPRELAG